MPLSAYLELALVVNGGRRQAKTCITSENLDQKLMRPFDSFFISTELICKYNPKNSSHRTFINN